MVRENYHHDIVLAQFSGVLQRGVYGRTGGSAGEDPFLLGEFPRDIERLLIIDVHDIVENRKIGGWAEHIVADALDQIRMRFDQFPSFEIIIVHRAVDINRNDLYLRILFFEIFPCSGNGPAGSDSADQVGDFAVGLSPDFRAGCHVVRLDVVEIMVLPDEVSPGGFLDEPLGGFIITLGIVGGHRGRADMHFGAERLEGVDFFGGHFVRDSEYRTKSVGCGEHGDRRTGVAGGRFDYGSARFQFAFLSLMFPDMGAQGSLASSIWLDSKGKQYQAGSPEFCQRVGSMIRHRGLMANISIRENLLLPFLYAADPDVLHRAREQADDVAEFLGLEGLDSQAGERSNYTHALVSLGHCMLKKPDVIVAQEVHVGMTPERLQMFSEKAREAVERLGSGVLYLSASEHEGSGLQFARSHTIADDSVPDVSGIW